MESEFRGTERFDVECELGRGGMGVVYRAFDRERGAHVALKTLGFVDATAIYRFKQEFRALADVTHPNLVALHEFFSAGEDQWFFTMELVAGKSFLAFVRGDEPHTAAKDSPTAGTQPIVAGFEGRRPSRPPSPIVQAPPPTPAEMERLRGALTQLAEAVCALHDLGKLHCDIKPSNVLVSERGRVVLLDFGLVTELRIAPWEEEGSGSEGGTPDYMAPERYAQQPMSPASDWYSVGVILYQALTGRLPFVGSAMSVASEKQQREPPAPTLLRAGLPDDLCALCLDLLRVAPEARPTGREVLRRVGSKVHRALSGPLSLPTQAVPFIARQGHMVALEEAFAASKHGQAVTALVHGSSGMGKSALVHRFLEGLRGSQEAVVLAGRCYEREAVPFKALDSVIDALSRFLVRLPQAECQALMPHDVLALTRVFPVLRRIEAVANVRRRGAESPDPRELRRRAFAGLRELLLRLADQHPVVLAIDDLQWSDVDSVDLLIDLMRPPDPPALLLLASYRSEEADSSGPLRAFLASQARSHVPVREIVIGPLGDDEARELTRVLLGGGPLFESHVDAIVSESTGNPFFITQLVEFSQGVDSGPSPDPVPAASKRGALRFDEVLRARLARLPPAARRLLELVAIAGQPLDRAVADRAGSLGQEGFTALAALRAQRLVRNLGVRGTESIDTYHDRIRETVIAQLETTVARDHHHRLAIELEASGHADPEALANHFKSGGQLERAGDYAAKAALQATEALAFDRAAKLYRMALELKPADDPQVGELRAHLGDALANVGRGAESAEAYLTAASGTAASAPLAARALELKRRAAEQLLRTGHIDQGLSALQTVLAEVRMNLPRTPLRALVRLLWLRARLWLRGLRFKPRDASQISAAELTRIDVCWSALAGLTLVDIILGASFQTRHLLLALAAGEPQRIARALAVECGFVASNGNSSRRRVERLVEASTALAKRVDQPYSIAWSIGTAGTAAFLLGDVKAARERCERSEAMLRENCTGVVWEITTVQIFLMWSLYYLGELAELSRRVPTLLREALERGDLYTATDLRLGLTNLVWLGQDEVDQARREIQEAMGQWSRRGFHLQHYYELLARGHIDLYADDPKAALDRIRSQWRPLTQSLHLRVQAVRVEALNLRARCSLAVASVATAREPFLRDAVRDARRIERENWPAGEALSQLILAGAATLQDRPERALELLEKAERGFQAREMALHAAAARRRRGELLGGAEGQALVDSSDAWMTVQGVRNPRRMVAVFAPGFARG